MDIYKRLSFRVYFFYRDIYGMFFSGNYYVQIFYKISIKRSNI